MEGEVVSTADLFVREGEHLVSTGVTSRHFSRPGGGH